MVFRMPDLNGSSTFRGVAQVLPCFCPCVTYMYDKNQVFYFCQKKEALDGTFGLESQKSRR